MAEKQTNKDRMWEIVDSIENGIKELFESDKYRKYLATMSRFHRYSVNNTMLIYMQRPDATHVAGFNKWRDQFGRNVLKGEKGIRIIAPTPYKKKVEEIKTDPETNAPVLDRVLYVKDGEIEREYTPAEFDSLSDGTRKEMGLRPFSLSKLKPANQYQAHTAKQMEFQNFCFAYKKREPESLHIPSAELPVGETIAIIGLNGAGKSTLARCICGLEKKCGLLQVDGKTLDWKARLKHCYMVMQDTSHQLFTESVTDEVLLSMDNKDETVVDKILKQFDLLEYKDRHPLSLSGGQKQRVAIASAIVSNREIIVFDEPTSGLDLKHMREVARSLKSLADQGKTLLVITHDPELVMAGCSYVVHMEKGQIKESYPLDESGSKKVLDFFRIRQ